MMLQQHRHRQGAYPNSATGFEYDLQRRAIDRGQLDGAAALAANAIRLCSLFLCAARLDRAAALSLSAGPGDRKGHQGCGTVRGFAERSG